MHRDIFYHLLALQFNALTFHCTEITYILFSMLQYGGVTGESSSERKRRVEVNNREAKRVRIAEYWSSYLQFFYANLVFYVYLLKCHCSETISLAIFSIWRLYHENMWPSKKENVELYSFCKTLRLSLCLCIGKLSLSVCILLSYLTWIVLFRLNLKRNLVQKPKQTE